MSPDDDRSSRVAFCSPFVAGRWLQWLLAGTLGGVALGCIDTGLVLVRGVGGAPRARLAMLLVAGAGLLGLAGALVGTLVSLAGIALRRLAPRRAHAAFAAAAALAAAPLGMRDAFSMFAGHQAQQIPAHQAISAVLSLLWVAAVFVAVRWYGRALDDVAAGRRSGRASWMPVLALAIAALVLHDVDRRVLPRLYPWFHDTLRALCAVLTLLAARLAVDNPRRRRMTASWLLAAAVLPAAVLGTRQLQQKQSLRFAAHEKAGMLGSFLRIVPLPAARPVTVAGKDSSTLALPPLPEGPRRPEADLVLITIDALRADHVGCYGQPRRTTPNIDQLAARGVRFQRVYAQAPHTSFSVSSILTGKYYPTLARLAPGEEHDPVPWLLRNYGWRTAAFYPPAVFFIDADKLRAYERTHFQFEYVKFEYIDAERRVDQVIDYYETVKPKRAFVWVHFFEPHEPYDDRPEFHFGDADVDRYDSEIAYTDAAVGRLIEYLGRERPQSIVVVTADHGEEFGEHGGRYHGSSLYEEQVRVPLVIAVPGVAPHVVEGPVQLVDVAPTLLSLIDIPAPVRMRGTDLGPWLRSPPASDQRLPAAFGEVEDKRMAVRGRDKLICDTSRGFCSLFDLGEDARELHNLVDVQPQRAAELRGLMDTWLDSQARLEPELARGAANPDGGAVPRAIERGRLGDVTVTGELAELLSSGATLAVRREAAQLLVRLPARPETRAFLTRAASDGDAQLAGWACVGALRAGDAAAQARVFELLQAKETERELRMRAALALAATGNVLGLPVLAQYLDGCPDVVVCRQIYATLGGLRDASAVPVIVQHLGEVQNRREMVEALGTLGSPAAIPALTARLREDEYVHVRVAAAHALAAIGASQALPALDEVARRPGEQSVRAAAGQAATTLRARAGSEAR